LGIEQRDFGERRRAGEKRERRISESASNVSASLFSITSLSQALEKTERRKLKGTHHSRIQAGGTRARRRKKKKREIQAGHDFILIIVQPTSKC